MLSVNENVGRGSQASLGFKGYLVGGTIGDLVKLNDFECDVLRLKQNIGTIAVGTVALGE